MHQLLNNNLFFIKEKTGVFKASNQYNILDPTTQKTLMECREPNIGFITKIFRFTDYKRMTPFEVVVNTAEGQPVLTIKRGFSLFRSKVEVFDEKNQLVGRFQQKLLSIGGKFEVLDAQDQHVCMLQGKWTSWEFTFKSETTEFAKVSKKWAGLGKELFTSADNYMLVINDATPANAPARLLILAAVMCIDMVLKE